MLEKVCQVELRKCDKGKSRVDELEKIFLVIISQ